jgi:hypothetical protein
MRESSIKIMPAVQLILTIDPSEQYPLAVISKLLSRPNITSTLVESLVCLNERLVQRYCGPKHAHGNGTKRVRRSVRCTCSAATAAGGHTFQLEHIETLHAVIRKTEHPDLDGTEVLLDGCTEEDIEEAKQNFLAYTDATSLEETRFGDVYEPSDDDPASIYVTGLRVATKRDSLFSYNITSTTKTIRDALNRERSNGGGMYTHRV